MLKYFYLSIVLMICVTIAINVNNIQTGNIIFGYTMLILNSISMLLWLAIFVREMNK